jgi:hypothetical protein
LTRTLSVFAGILGLLLLLGFVEIETLLLASSRSLGDVATWASTITLKGGGGSISSAVEEDDSTTLAGAAFCPINSSNYLDWAQSLPKYELKGFCSNLPADLSSTYLWNQHLEWILDATLHSLPTQQQQQQQHGGKKEDNNMDDDDVMETTLEWMSDLLLWLTPQHLRKGYLGRPQHEDWGNVLQHLYQRQQGQQDRPLLIVILGSTIAEGIGSCVPPPHLASSWTKSSSSRRRSKTQQQAQQAQQHNCGWSHRLEYFLNHILGGTPSHPIVQVTRWTLSDTTTEFATSIIEHGLWPPHVSSLTSPHTGNSPDVIINAYSSHDMYNPDRGVLVDMDDFNYTHHRRRVQEAFLRAALHSRPCSPYPPLVIQLDDYLGHHHPTVMAELTNARVLQQMADWYQVSLISYANVVRRWVYADISEQVFSPNWHSTMKEKKNDLASTFGGVSIVDDPDNSGAMEEKLTNNVHYGLVAHVSVLWTMAFSLLSATVEYCSHEVMRLDEYPFVTKELMDLVAHVPPPELNADLCLSNVSEKWQEEQEKLQQRRARLCSGNTDSKNKNNSINVTGMDHRKDLPHCAMAFWPRYSYHHGKIDKNVETTLKPFTVEQTGWSMKDRKRGLVATQRGAKLRLQVPIVDPKSALQRLRLFVIRHVDWTKSKLKWDVRVWNATLPDQEWNQTTFITAGHQADVTQLSYLVDMELPVVVQEGFKVEMTFELVQGTNFEIKAMMLCNNPP